MRSTARRESDCLGFAPTETDVNFHPGSSLLSPEPFDEEGQLSAPAFLFVTSPSASGWLPLPEKDSCEFRLVQTMPDGTEAENIILLTPEGIRMISSNCSNHDCLMQGEVTLENRDERVLSNMIICLPHQVVLELYSREEVLARFGKDS